MIIHGPLCLRAYFAFYRFHRIGKVREANRQWFLPLWNIAFFIWISFLLYVFCDGQTVCRMED